jgi:hypothetical protein
MIDHDPFVTSVTFSTVFPRNNQRLKASSPRTLYNRICAFAYTANISYFTRRLPINVRKGPWSVVGR